jgi:hypothetical protein
VIGVWAAVGLRRDGMVVPMDRPGHPTIKPFINPEGQENLYNSRHPADDVADYLRRRRWTRGVPATESVTAAPMPSPCNGARTRQVHDCP